MEKILERMKKSPLVFDGAMGTMIYERGVFINTCFDELSLSNPKLIRQIHSDYVEAGAEGIETNTFGAEQIGARVAEGVDLVVLETFTHLKELQRAARAAKKLGATVLASFALNDRGETAVGKKAGAIAQALESDGNVDIVGINCGTGPAGVFDALHSVLPQVGKPVVVMPNAGFPRDIGGGGGGAAPPPPRPPSRHQATP